MANAQTSSKISKRHYSTSYHFNKNLQCLCSSGRLFGECCGSGSRPQEVIEISDYLPNKECRQLIRFAEKQNKVNLSVVEANADVSERSHRQHSSRKSQLVDTRKRQSFLIELFRNACAQYISRLAQPDWFEYPQLLQYKVGGRYKLHSDAEHFDHQENNFYRFIDRDFSMLIYLNDDYEGGELSFPWLNYKYKPKQGSLVIFPSSHIYSHESLPVSKGKKFALVSWGAFKHTVRVAPPGARIFL